MPKGTAVLDTFNRTLTGSLGSTDTGQAWSSFTAGGGSLADYNIAGSLTVSQSGTGVYHGIYLSAISETDVDVAVTGVLGQPSTGAPIEVLHLLTRGQSISSYYMFRVQVETDDTLTMVMFAPDGTELARDTVQGFTRISNTGIRMRAQSIGAWHRMKVWRVADGEPPIWHLSAVDRQYIGPGWIGTRVGIAVGNTNTKPWTFTLDNFESVQVPDYTTDRVPVRVLWAPGADFADDYRLWPWEDITDDVRQGSPVSITLGRRDESSTTQPAACTLQLNNPDKAYAAYDPASPNYPNVRKNTPIMVLANEATRFFGYADGFPQSTPDVSGKVPVVPVSAHGTLRRLQQGKTPIASPALRGILATDPVAYLPMEDAEGSTQFASALPGAPAALLVGTWDFARDTALLGSKPLPTMSDTSELQYAVFATFATGWQVDWHTHLPSSTLPNPTAEFVLMRVWTNGSANRWDLVAGNDGSEYFALRAVSSTGASLLDSGHLAWASLMHAGWAHVHITAHQSGSNIQWKLVMFPSLGGSGFALGASTFAGTWGGATSISIPHSAGLDGIAIGHIAVYDAYDFIQPGLPVFGYPGETPPERLTRICADNSVTLNVIGDSTTLMGAQFTDTLPNTLRDCEATEQGLLFDGMASGLSFITRQMRENVEASLTIDASAGQLAPPFAPVDDDQLTRNLWEVSRKSGSSARFEDKSGPLGTDTIGTYDDSKTVNIDDVSRLTDYAAWLVHVGTTEGFRHPSLSLNLRGTPELTDDWLATPLNGRIDATNVSSATAQHPDGVVSQMLEGYTETLSPFVWTVEANCSPYDPWRIGTLGTGSGDTGESIIHLDSPDTTLNASASAGATSLSLKVNAGPLWITGARDANSFPLYLNVGGIKVKVTNIAGASSPQTATVDGSTVTLALPAGAPVHIWRPPVLGL